MNKEIATAVEQAVQELYGQQLPADLTRPDEQFGDYATNVALRLAKPLGRNPRDVAAELAEALRKSLAEHLKVVTVAGPGFINLLLDDVSLLNALRAPAQKPLDGQTIVAEYSDPNPFKVLHAGHLYTSVVGDAVANILHRAGATVHRVNFGGDVGPHVARAMWGMISDLGGELPDKLDGIPPENRAKQLSEWYVAGNTAYENGEKDAIAAYNKRIYALHDTGDHDSPFARMYWTGRQWSYDYFDAFYARLGISFEKYYPESQTAPIGVKAVRDHPEIFTESDGAIVFDGGSYNLHTRVFMTSQGLPTYETKDMGASLAKYADYHFDQSIIITGNDIVEYMKVVLKAIEQFEPRIAHATRHLTHGIVKLAGGVKMSSRLGNVLTAVDILNAAQAANQQATGSADERTTIGAVKYALLRQRLGGGDIIYDPAESVSLEGNSGPYLQYAHARACSILRKAGSEGSMGNELEPDERSLVRKLTEYPEAVAKATTELLPHHICTYLYELAQQFNRFYEHNRVIGEAREVQRLGLVAAYRDTLAEGLALLGIAAPDSM